MDKFKSKHFLIVENDADDAFMIKRAVNALPQCGSSCVCRNGSEARAYLQGAGMYADRSRYPVPDAIISDLRMEGETGVQLVHWIRQQEELQNTPLVILTGSASPDEMAEAELLGLQKVYRKPPSLEELQQLLIHIANTMEADVELTGVRNSHSGAKLGL